MQRVGCMQKPNYTSNKASSTSFSKNPVEIAKEGIKLIEQAIRYTTAGVDQLTINDSDRYQPRWFICSCLIKLREDFAMNGFDQVFIHDNKSYSNEDRVNAALKLIDNRVGVCFQQCIILALYLLENGVPVENIKLVGFKNENSKEEGQVMLLVDGKMYFDPLTGLSHNNVDKFSDDKYTQIPGLHGEYIIDVKAVYKFSALWSGGIQGHRITEALNTYKKSKTS